MKIISLTTWTLIALFVLVIQTDSAAESESHSCLECHSSLNVLPTITVDWENSKHAGSGVSCKDCHTADPDDPDAREHLGFYISPVVSTSDCGSYHAKEFEENNQSLHARPIL